MEQGSRFNEGKKRFSIAPFGAIEQVMAVGEFGAKKYGDRNYQKGLPISSFLDSAFRHAFVQFLIKGEDNDQESGLPHLAHAAWNLLAALEQMQRLPKLDDRTKTEPPKIPQPGGLARLREALKRPEQPVTSPPVLPNFDKVDEVVKMFEEARKKPVLDVDGSFEYYPSWQEEARKKPAPTAYNDSWLDSFDKKPESGAV